MTSLYFIGFFLGFGVGKKTGERDLILEAVRNGAGRWGGDKKGRAEFQWITNLNTSTELRESGE